MKPHHLAIIILLAIVCCSCRTYRSASVQERTTVVHDTLRTVSYRDRTLTDTLHDSVYVREVVTEEGRPVYRERTVWRDRKAQVLTFRDTVTVRLRDSTATARSQESASEHGSIDVGWQEALLLVCLIGAYLIVLAGLYLYHKTGK